MYARAPHMHLVPLEVRGEQWIPGTEVTDSCELPYEYQESSLCPPEEQPMLLTAEPRSSTLCGSEISGCIPGSSQAREEHWFPGSSHARGECWPLFPAMPGESTGCRLFSVQLVNSICPDYREVAEPKLKRQTGNF